MKVVMPVWIINEKLVELTKDAINSIRSGGEITLVIIDNASPLGGGMLREMADIYIRNKENLGYAKAVNQGLKLCETEELVAISNNDIRVSTNWLDVTNEVMKDKAIGTLHFRMILYEEPFSPDNDIWTKGKERWCTSSFFVTRNIQLYDEAYLNSYDDWDYHKRMRINGFQQAYTNKVEYQHMDSFTQQFIPNRNDNDTRNREYFKTKYGMYPEDDFDKSFPGERLKQYRPFP